MMERGMGIGFKERVYYGIGNLGFGIVFQTIGSYLVFYGTAVLQIPSAWIGLAVSVGVIWDAVSDPLMGHISDHTTSSRFGRRHGYLLIGIIGIVTVNVLLWSIPSTLSVTTKALMVFAYLFLMKTFMTVYGTPYTALGAELSSDYNERTRIQAYKTVFFLIGILIAVSVCLLVFFKATPEYPMGQLNPMGYASMGIFASAVMLITGLLAHFKTKQFIPQLNAQAVQGQSSLIQSLGQILKNPNYRAVLLGYLFTNTASGIIGTIGLHVFTYSYLLSSQQIAAIFGMQIIVSILSQGVWTGISSRLDKKPAVLLGVGITIGGCAYILVVTLLRAYINNFFPYLLVFSFFVGFGMGGLFSIPLSMIADVTDQEAMKHGERSEGISFGGLTLGYKLSQSLAIFLLGLVLQWIQFNPDVMAQKPFTVTALGLILPVGGLVCFVLAYLSYNTYQLNFSKVKCIQEELARQAADDYDL